MIKYNVSNRAKRKANLALLEPSTKMKEQRSRAFQTPGLIVFMGDDNDRVKRNISHAKEKSTVFCDKSLFVNKTCFYK